MDPGVFDNVLPVDGVCVAQEVVAVNIHTSIQDLCRDKRGDGEGRVSVNVYAFLRASLGWKQTEGILSGLILISDEDRWKAGGRGKQATLRETHHMMAVVSRVAGTKACHVAVISNIQFLCLWWLFSSFSLHTEQKKTIMLWCCHHKKIQEGGFNPPKKSGS